MRLEELLSLKDHRDTRRGEDKCSPENRALLREDTVGLSRIDLGRNAGAAVGVGIVRLGEDDSAEGIAVVTPLKHPANRAHVSVLVACLVHGAPDDGTKSGSHWLLKPAPPEAVGEVICPSLRMSSAMRIFSG